MFMSGQCIWSKISSTDKADELVLIANNHQWILSNNKILIPHVQFVCCIKRRYVTPAEKSTIWIQYEQDYEAGSSYSIPQVCLVSFKGLAKQLPLSEVRHHLRHVAVCFQTVYWIKLSLHQSKLQQKDNWKWNDNNNIFGKLYRKGVYTEWRPCPNLLSVCIFIMTI